MLEHLRPYVGVTGPTSSQEVKHLVNTFRENNLSLETERQPMIGFLVSYKTLNGEPVASKRYPSIDTLPSLLEATETYTFNTIHYNSRQLDTLSDQIVGIFTGRIYNDNLCRGLQLNIPWPPIDELVNIKKALPELKIIMQLSSRSLKEKSPQEVASLVMDYSRVINYVLIDPSGGQGREFEAESVVGYFSEIRSRLPNLAIGFAGGFTGENVVGRCAQIASLIGTRDFSIDAEGGLRDKITDEYDRHKTEDYIKEASRFFI